MSTSCQRRLVQRQRKHNRPLGIFILAIIYLGLLAPPLLTTTSKTKFNHNSRSTTPLAPRTHSIFLHTTVRATGYANGFCTGNNPSNKLRSSSPLWLVFLLPLTLFCFTGLAIVTDDYFVESLEKVVECLGVPEDIAGASFMAIGSSAPELFTSMISTLVPGEGHDLGIGTIVGSAVFNICVIIGLSALCAKETLHLDFRPILRDSVFYTASVLFLLVFVLFSSKGTVLWWEGLVLIIVYVAYLLFMAYGNKKYMSFFATRAKAVNDACPSADVESPETDESMRAVDDEKNEHDGLEMIRLDDDSPTTSIDSAESSEEKRKVLGVELPSRLIGWVTLPFFLPWRLAFRYSIPDCSAKGDDAKWNLGNGRLLPKWPLTFTASVIWVMVISYIMVEAANLAGCFMGIPSAIMGLTILAAGTSVPDALASISVVKMGRGDMAVSNAIGSNVFDILIGLGLPYFIKGLIDRTGAKVTVQPISLVVIPIAILFIINALLLLMLPYFKWKLGRPLGFVLFVVYGGFVTYSLIEFFVNR